MEHVMIYTVECVYSMLWIILEYEMLFGGVCYEIYSIEYGMVYFGI